MQQILYKMELIRQKKFAKTWVYRIMINEIYRFLKQPIPINREEVLEGTSVTNQYMDFDLREVLDELPKEDKLVIMLRYFEDMKLEEIAKLQEEPLSTIKSRLYRGLKKMRIKLEH